MSICWITYWRTYNIKMVKTTFLWVVTVWNNCCFSYGIVSSSERAFSSERLSSLWNIWNSFSCYIHTLNFLIYQIVNSAASKSLVAQMDCIACKWTNVLEMEIFKEVLLCSKAFRLPWFFSLNFISNVDFKIQSYLKWLISVYTWNSSNRPSYLKVLWNLK